jgi:F-type H+-transporting ATPase subunit a
VIAALLSELNFPPIQNLVEWPNAFGTSADSWYGFNKIAMQSVLAVLFTVVLFVLARQKKMVPTGAQNLAETSVNFIEEGIIMQTIGEGGTKYLPYLTTLFFFILFGNLFEVIPGFQMPANARMANPAIMALATWAMFICVGVKAQGPLKYLKSSIIVPDIPIFLHVLTIPIEFISTFIVRPFSLAVRLFANMLAGHILLVTFGVLCITLATASLLALALPFSFFMLVALTGFEVMVAFLQAYIFTILAAVYIGGALHPDH